MPNPVDAYLARLPDDQRAALARVRTAVLAAAKGGEECLAYGKPAVRVGGKVVVAYGASARHCAFYPMSGTTVAAHADALAGWETSKGAIRFPASRPLPAALVRTLVQARLRENAGA